MNDWVRRSSAGMGKISLQLILWFAIFGLGPFLQAQPAAEPEGPGVAMDQSHESGSRWKEDFVGRSNRPWLALLWFKGNSAAMETEIFKSGHLSTTSITMLNSDRYASDTLGRRAMEQITNILASLPDSTPSVPLQEQMRVSWDDKGMWNSRVYSRATPPRAMVELHRAIQLRFWFHSTELQLLNGEHRHFLADARGTLESGVGGNGLVISRWDAKTIRIQIPAKPGPFGYSITNYPQGEPFTKTNLYISRFSLSADGSKGAYHMGDDIYLIDLPTGKLLWQRKPRLNPKVMKLSPDGTRLLVYDGDDLDLYETSSEKAPQHLLPEQVEVQAFDFSPDGRMIAWSSGGTVVICDLSGAAQQTLNYRDGILSLAFSPDSAKLAVTLYGRGMAMIHEIASGKVTKEVPLWVNDLYMDIGPNELQWSPGGKFLAIRYPSSGPLVIADVAQERPVAFLKQRLACIPAFNKTETGLLAVEEEQKTIHFLALPAQTPK